MFWPPLTMTNGKETRTAFRLTVRFFDSWHGRLGVADKRGVFQQPALATVRTTITNSRQKAAANGRRQRSRTEDEMAPIEDHQ